MVDPYTLIPIITGVVSATVQIGIAIHRWWQNHRDRRTANVAFQASQPTSQAAKDLQSLMEVQSAFWRSNPGMWQALGHNAASIICFEPHSDSQKSWNQPTPTQISMPINSRNMQPVCLIEWTGTLRRWDCRPYPLS